MEPFEIMISESQERMAAVVEPHHLDEVIRTCARWELDCTAVGRVVAGDLLTCRFDGEVVGELPVASLVDNCPRYALDPVRPARLAAEPADTAGYPVPGDLGAVLLELLAAPNVASKAWVYRQYDQYVGSGSVIRPGGDAAVVRLTPSDRAIAISLDGNGRRTALDPRRGGAEAVLEAARNVACAGGRPTAITNCLNFGNPERGETPYMLGEAVDGMAAAAAALGLPVVSGNVSLYNEHAGGPIPPTPVVGCVGVLESASDAVPHAFSAPGDVVLLVTAGGAPAIDGSEYQRTVHGRVDGTLPEPDLAGEAALCAFLATAAREGLLRSAHDVSDGGLAVALAEACLPSSLGVEAAVPDTAGRADITLFGEGRGAVIVSCAPAAADPALGLAAGLGAGRIGVVTAEPRIVLHCGAARLEIATPAAAAAHGGTIPAAMGNA
jgi:phosphoribosylformylglycinamidine synthase